MKIAVGCPVSNRGWILPSWFSHVEDAFSVAGATPHFVFVVGDSEDNTESVILDRVGRHPYTIVRSDEEAESGLKREWTHNRFEFMAGLRNCLLGAVRDIAPDFFFSVDSDILLHHESLYHALTVIEGYWAVGSKLYLQPPPNKNAPNYAMLRSASLHRPDSEGVFKVDVLMALKLMTPSAYNVNYVFDEFGEDIGWSKKVKEAGGTLVWDGNFASKHVMKKELLGKVDPRIGW